MYQESNNRQCNDQYQKLQLGLRQNLNPPPRRAPDRFKHVLFYLGSSTVEINGILSGESVDSKRMRVTQLIIVQLMGFTDFVT